MTNATLCLHAGGASATIDELRAVPVPEATRTWHPVSHDRVVEMTTSALTNAGYKIEQSHFGLAKHGKRLFGTFDVQSEIAGGVGLAVGIRSSLDQQFAIGFCCGSRVFVCDNLAFRSDTTVKRKHTRFGADRFYDAICQEVSNLEAYRKNEALWINAMQEKAIDDRTAADLILRGFEKDVIGVQAIPQVLKEWREPSLESQAPRNAWGLFNAFTYVLKTHRTHEIARRSINLRSLFDAAI